jgi:hypothetical protein
MVTALGRIVVYHIRPSGGGPFLQQQRHSGSTHTHASQGEKSPVERFYYTPSVTAYTDIFDDRDLRSYG